jgi:hypothetical protein
MTFTRVATVTALLLWCAGPASAQAVRLEFHDGRVNLTTQNASLRAILTEWARLGGTQVVNAERLTGAPVTVQLTDIPETQALDIILRGSAGYIAGERASAAQASQSSLDRILVLPPAGTATPAATTVAARPVTAAPPTFQQAPQAFVQPDPDEPADVPDDDRPNRGTRPGVPPVIRMVAPNGQVVAQPFVIEDDAQPAPAPTATPSNPFGVTGGSARPGMPPPPPPQPQRPANTRDQEP